MSRLLEPFHHALDQCWWFLNGHGHTFPAPEGYKGPSPPCFDSYAGYQEWTLDHPEWLAAKNDQVAEYSRWIDDAAGYNVGLPGWYSRYVDFADSDWAIYFACASETDELPRTTLDRLNSFHSQGVNWFDDPSDWSLPQDVVAACRNIDNVYWDLFFADREWHV